MTSGGAPGRSAGAPPEGSAAFAARLRPRLKTWFLGRRLDVVDETGSTNDLAREALAAAVDPSALDGAVFLALHQTKGRGRHGRSWVAPAGSSFLGSAIVSAAGASIPAVTAAAALGVAEGLDRLVPSRPTIKWPNDLLVRGAKIAGILIEATPAPGGPSRFVVGVGVNGNQARADFPPELRETATSVRIVSGRSVDAVVLALEVLRNLDRRFAELRAGDEPGIEHDFLARLGLERRRVRVATGNRETEGTLEAISFRDGVRLTAAGRSTTLPCETVSAIAPA